MASRGRRKARWAVVILGLVACSAPAAVEGQELNLGIRTAAEYDDRVVGDEGDAALLVRPEIELRDPKGQLQWELEYRPFYEAFLDFSDANGLSHTLRAEGTWEVTRRTTFEISDRFRDLNRERLFNEQVTDEAGETITVDRVSTERLRTNDLEAELTHQLSLVSSLLFTLEHSLRDREERDLDEEAATTRFARGDNSSLLLSGRFLRRVTPTTTLGLGLSASRSEVEQRLRDDSRTDFFNVFGSWQYEPDETLEISLAAGPTLVRADRVDPELSPVTVRAFPLNRDGEHVDATTCPATDEGRTFLSSECDGVGELGFTVSGFTTASPVGEAPSRSDSTVSFFANGSIRKRWSDWTVNLRYRRRQSNAGTLGSSTISDLVSGGIRWEPTARWRLDLNAQWNRRSQATDRVAQVFLVDPIGPNSLGPPGSPLPNEAAVVTGVAATTVEDDIDTTVVASRLSASYELTHRVSLFGRFFYNRQTGTLAEDVEDTDTMRVTVGVDYTFDPIRF